MYLSPGKCNPLPTFDCTVTVLSRLKSAHSANKLDAWFKTVLRGNAFTAKTVRTVAGTTVSVGRTCVLRVPKNDSYKPYSEWIKNQIGFTFSVGDIVIKGEIDEVDITPNNVTQILQKYQPNAFTVKVFKDNTCANLAPHYYVEGV